MTVSEVGRKITADEWILQWRGIGKWIGALLVVAFPLLEVIFSSDPSQAAELWSDGALLAGVIYGLFVTPFVLDRIRRTQIEAVELSKPFRKWPYLSGKFMGTLLPLLLLPLLSGVLSFVAALFIIDDVEFVPLLLAFGRGYLLITLPPVVFLAALGYCLSLFLRPIIIVPLGLLYLTWTSFSQQAADARFSWLSPLVRPDYFWQNNRIIPEDLVLPVLLHQLFYLALAGVLVLVTIAVFDRRRWLGAGGSRFDWSQVRNKLPVVPISPGLRRFLGAPVVAALVLAVLSPSQGLSRGDHLPEDIQQLSGMFVLEFYFALVGLLLVAGVAARDKGIDVMDLVLTKPVNRWKLLAQRLLPAVVVYLVVAAVLILGIHFTFIQLPLVKAFVVAIATGIYLGMVGMTVANVTRSALAGYAAGIVYLLAEAGFRGTLTLPFYLLITTQQPGGADFWRLNESLWIPSKIGLLLLAGWLFILNGWLLDEGPGRRRALVVMAATIPLIFAVGRWSVPILWR